MTMEIHIKVVENGFTIEVKYTGYQGWNQYVAENERSLLDTISMLWRDYKNKQAQEKANDNRV